MKIYPILPLLANARTSATFNPQLTTSIEGLVSVATFMFTTATVGFDIQGKMEGSDEWVTIKSITQADIGTTLGATLTYMARVDLMPWMQIVVTVGNAATFTQATIMEY